MRRDVLLYPDPRLKQLAAPIADFGDAERALAADLVDTLRAFTGCVGVAAPQLGALVRAVAVDVTGHKKARSCRGLTVLFNPRVTAAEGADVAREGCLSLPDFTANVRRASRVAVSGISADGAPISLEADAFEARVLLHEIDHLDGLLFLDRVASLATDVFRRKAYR